MDTLTSPKNPKIREVILLRERRHRDRSGRFLIEGYRELSRAVDSEVEIAALFVCPELYLGENEPSLIERCGARTYRCPPEIFRKISYRDRPDGLLAVALQWQRTLDDLPAGSLYVVAEAIEKPGNLGTILRSCDATGVDGVIVCDRCTDIFNPNTVRASVGTLFSVPVIEAGGEETITWLQDRGISILAATPAAKALYTEVDLTGPVAVALGTEQLGLSERWLDAADLRVRLPMSGSADSLNVAMAATVLLYEAVRQRG